MGEVCKVRRDEVNAIGIKWKGRKIVRVDERRKFEEGNMRYEPWVKKLTGVLRSSDRILLWDCNMHHRK